MSSSALASVHSSNMPAHHKSAIRRFWEQAKGGGAMLSKGKAHLRAGGEVLLRQGGESLLVGAALGAAHVELPNGLDYKFKNFTIPVDGVVGAVGLIGGVLLADESSGKDLANAGASGATIFAFRETFKFVSAKKKAGGGKVGGTFGEDEDYGMNGEDDDAITACAREIGG